MLRTALVVCALISLSVCQIGGTTGPCSAYPVPGNFYDPLSLFGSTTASQVFTSPCSVASYSGFTWYTITPEAGATVNITTCSSYTNFDTVLSLYTGDCSSLSCLEFDDDSCGRASNLSFAADGQTYYVSVSGYSAASGSFELTFSASQPAVIDLGCNGSIAIPGPYFTPVTILGNNEGKQGSDANTCGVSASSKIDWYTITPSNGTRVEISTCSSTTNFDTRLAIFTGTCGGLNCFTYNDDNCTIFSLASGLSFISSSSYYYLAVFGYGAAAGTYTVRISESYTANSTATNCTAAIALPFVPGQLLAINSTTHASNVSLVSACGKPHPAPSSWYKIEVPSDYKHPITASTCRHGTMFDTMLYVYSGSCDQLICTGHNDDGCTNGSVVTWNVPNPTDLHAEVVPLTFYIQVAGFAVSAGNFELSIQ